MFYRDYNYGSEFVEPVANTPHREKMKFKLCGRCYYYQPQPGRRAYDVTNSRGEVTGYIVEDMDHFISLSPIRRNVDKALTQAKSNIVDYMTDKELKAMKIILASWESIYEQVTNRVNEQMFTPRG